MTPVAMAPLLLALLPACACQALCSPGGGDDHCDTTEDSQALLQLKSPRTGSGSDDNHDKASWPLSWTKSQKAMADRLNGRWTGGMAPGWNTWTFAWNTSVNKFQVWDAVYGWGQGDLYPVRDTFQGILVFRDSGDVAVPERTFIWKFVGSWKLKKTWVFTGPDKTEYGPLWYSKCSGGWCKCRIFMTC